MSGDTTLPGGARPSVLSLTIKERSALYAAYIPHLRRGGIFIPTNRPYRLGDSVFMLLVLMDDPHKHAVAGQVVWITPANAQGNKAQGIGVQFSDDDTGRAAKARIENLLAGSLQSTRATHTY